MPSEMNDNDDTGVVLYWKDPAKDEGSFYRISKDVWDKLEIGDAESGLPAALVSRGAIVATMKDGTHPAGSWSTLLNISALLDAHAPDKKTAKGKNPKKGEK